MKRIRSKIVVLGLESKGDVREIVRGRSYGMGWLVIVNNGEDDFEFFNLDNCGL